MAALLVSVLAIWIVATSLLAVIDAYVPIPFGDQWDNLDPAKLLAEPFAQHNEHRIAVPRLIYLTDLLVFDASNRFNLAAILTVQLLHWALFSWLVWRCVGAGPAARLALCATLLCLFLSLQQWENFFWGFQSAFVLVYLAASCAFVALAVGSGIGSGGGATETSTTVVVRPGWLLLSAAAAAVAVFCLANGVLVPLLLLSLGWLLRLPRRHLLLFALFAAGLIGFYLHGYRSPGNHANPLESLGQPLAVLHFLTTTLGAGLADPLHRISLALGLDRALAGEVRQLFASIVGSAGLLAALGFGVLALLRRHRLGALSLASLHIAAFVTGGALLTALGRLHVPISQAFASRYATPSFVFWAALLVLLWVFAARLPGRGGRLARIGLVALCTALSLGLAINQLTVAERADAVALKRWDAGLALVAEVQSEGALLGLSSRPDRLVEQAAVLRDDRKAVFQLDWSRWLGDTLNNRVSLLDETACEGQIEALVAIPTLDRRPGYRVNGWAWDRRRDRPVEMVLLVDDEARIVGFARGQHPRPDLRRVRPDLGVSGWAGWVSTRPPGQVTAYGLLDGDDGACRLDGAATVTEASVALGEAIGERYDLVRRRRCLGGLDVVRPIGRSRGPAGRRFRAFGWAWDVAARRPGDLVLLADKDGRLIGASVTRIARPEVFRARRKVTSEMVGWRAVVSLRRPTKVTAYVLLADGRSLCPLSRHRRVDAGF